MYLYEPLSIFGNINSVDNITMNSNLKVGNSWVLENKDTG